MSEKISIEINRKDLEWIRQTALRRLLDGVITKDFDLDSSQQITLCYVDAVESYLLKQGIKIEIKLNRQEAARKAYETIDG
jgi:hypothetical protein